MKTYSKRIGFLIADQHFIPHGGIGQFAKGFTELCGRIDWKVDIILDKAPTNAFSDYVKSLGANIVYPEDALKYSDHTATFAFSDSINFEKIVNFRKSILHAFQTNIYDMLVCNTQEAMSAAYAMGISKYMPVVFYTHSYSMVFRDEQDFSDVCIDAYHTFYNKHMEFSDIFVGTQSQKNKTELTKYGATNCEILRMPLSERGLLDAYTGPREGVLFIGRWEERKNPAAYIKIMKETGLPCRVMTNSNGAKKFEAKFKEAGITDYVIKAGIVGQEKVDFIKGSKVFFMPALGENYPFAFSECLGHMPCVVLDNQEWSDNFDSKYFVKTKLTSAAEHINTAYQMDPAEYAKTGALDYIYDLDSVTAKGWVSFLDTFVAKRSNSNAAKINNNETVCYRDYITALNRTHLAREDFESVLANRYKFIINVYTDDNTYLSKDPLFNPTEESSGSGLFDGL
jgi:glycosyltransferase involved in cell wall biosynthesis